MQSNISIGLATKASDIVQAQEAFQRLGMSAEDAGKLVSGLAEGAKVSGGKIESAMVTAAAAVNRFATAADSGSTRAGRAGEQAAFQIEKLQQAIEEARATGGPVPESAIATLKQLDATLDTNIRKVAQFKNVQDDMKDSMVNARSAADLQRGSVNDLGDVVAMLGPKMAGALGIVSATAGGFMAGYAATRKFIEGLRELLGVDVDSWVQDHLKGIAEWVVGVDASVGAADRMRNAQNILKHRGIDPTGKSLEELDRLVEENSRKVSEAAVKYEADAEKRKRAAEQEAAELRRLSMESRDYYEAQRKALDGLAQRTRDYIASLSPMAGAVTTFTGQMKLAAESLDAVLAGVLSPEEWQRAFTGYVAAFDASASKVAADVLKQFKGLEPTAGKAQPTLDSEELKRYLQLIKEAQERNKTFVDTLYEWTPAIDMAGQAIASFNFGLGQGIQQAARLTAQVIEAYKAWKASGSQQGFTGEGVASGMAIGGQVGSMGQSFGWWSGDRGKSGFGGKMSGDYGDLGSTIGGALGSFFGPVGALVGGLIGGVLGGLVKKGADEGLATLRQTVTGVAMMVSLNEGGLGDLLGQVGDAIDTSLRSILDQIGGQLESIPEVSFKIRDNVVSVWVGAVKGRFSDLQEATKFAIQEILRQGEISGIGEAVKQALENSYGKSLEQLADSLDFAQYVDDLKLDEVGKAIQDQMRGFGAAMRKAIDLGFGSDLIVAELGRNLTAIRNQILGISESEEDRIRRQAASFNAEIAIMRAEQQAKQIDLQLKKADLESQVALLAAEGKITTAGLELAQERVRAHADMVEIEGAILMAEGQIEKGKISLLGSALYQLRAVTDALAAVDVMLANLPSLITPDEIASAISHINYGGGGNVGSVDTGPSPADRLADLNGQLDSLRRETMPDMLRRLVELREQFAALRATAVELGQSTEELDRMEALRLATLREEITTQLRGFTAGSGDSAGWQSQMDEIARWFGQTLDAAAALGIDSADVVKAYQGRVAELRDTILSSLSPLFSVQKRFTDLGRTLEWLDANAAALGITEAELGRIRSEMGQTMFLDLAERMARAVGDEQALAALQQLRWQMELVQYQLEVERLTALGLLTQDQIDMLNALLGQALLFDPASTTGTGGLTPEQAAYWAAIRQQEAADMMAEAAQRLQDAVDTLIDFQRSLFLSNLSPLTPQQRLDEATQQAQALVQQILSLGPNDTRRPELMQQLPDLLRAYLTELGSVWGTASAQYAAGFAWVNSILNQLTGGNVIPFPTTGGGGPAGGGTGITDPPIRPPQIGPHRPIGSVVSFPGMQSRGGSSMSDAATANDLLGRAVRLLESIERKTAATDTEQKRRAAGALR